MENIVDVEYREVAALEDKETEVLAAEANVLFTKAEAIAAASVEMLVEAGKRLRIVKGRIGHGEWLDWVENNLTFNKSKAAYIMKLAEKSEEEGGLFSNFQTFGNIGISKVLALLEAPEEAAKEVVETMPVEDITVRELKEELKRVKDENKALSEAGEEERKTAKELSDHVCELKAKLDMARKQAAQAEAQAAEMPDTSALEEQLEVSKKALKEYKAKVKADQDRTKREHEAEVEAMKAETEAAAKAAAEKEIAARTEQAIADAVKDAEGEMETLRREVDRLQKLSDPATGEFKAHADSLQAEFNACLAAIDQAAPENKEKWRDAMRGVIEAMEGQLR